MMLKTIIISENFKYIRLLVFKLQLKKLSILSKNWFSVKIPIFPDYYEKNTLNFYF